MSNQIPAFPLTWPDSLPRTGHPVTSQFRTSLSAALKNVKASLELFAKDSGKAVTAIVLSSNAGRLDLQQPKDPGVAAWFEWDGQQRCIAVDRYPKVEDNLQAIHHIIEAQAPQCATAGCTSCARRSRASPRFRRRRAGGDGEKCSGSVPTSDLPVRRPIDARYRELAARAHPDKGGSTEAMAELNRARAEAKVAIA